MVNAKQKLMDEFNNRYVVSEICPDMFNVSAHDPYRIFAVVTQVKGKFHLLLRMEDGYEFSKYYTLDCAIDTINKYFAKHGG